MSPPLAGALFIAADLFLTYGQPQRLIQWLFRHHAHPSMKRADVDRAVPHASTRIVAFIHILIQVLASARTIQQAMLLRPSSINRAWSPNHLGARRILPQQV